LFLSWYGIGFEGAGFHVGAVTLVNVQSVQTCLRPS
jgi:hypothetical protein